MGLIAANVHLSFATQNQLPYTTLTPKLRKPLPPTFRAKKTKKPLTTLKLRGFLYFLKL